MSKTDRVGDRYTATMGMKGPLRTYLHEFFPGKPISLILDNKPNLSINTLELQGNSLLPISG
jgi:hypothetical protein